ncbi:hypothetical protein C2845_PM11G02370 [Panicum miliaceum]|uniref:Uncharacterized protein n=1 Tax=Panicum miliaceum TaxID=4540 RepID=A0A3L6RSJ4_PANMI|nr:hypothetical protein C2845_PM11G02370 [Panicum miliaceum]
MIEYRPRSAIFSGLSGKATGGLGASHLSAPTTISPRTLPPPPRLAPFPLAAATAQPPLPRPSSRPAVRRELRLLCLAPPLESHLHRCPRRIWSREERACLRRGPGARVGLCPRAGLRPRSRNRRREWAAVAAEAMASAAGPAAPSATRRFSSAAQLQGAAANSKGRGHASLQLGTSAPRLQGAATSSRGTGRRKRDGEMGEGERETGEGRGGEGEGCG